MRKNFMFNYNGAGNGNVYELAVVKENLNENDVSFTPKEFKKRRLIEPIHEDRCNDDGNNTQRKLNFDDHKMQDKLSCVLLVVIICYVMLDIIPQKGRYKKHLRKYVLQFNLFKHHLNAI